MIRQSFWVIRQVLRVLLLVVAGFAILALLFPMRSGASDSGTSKTCIAIRDGWSRAPRQPSLAEFEEWMNKSVANPTAPESKTDAIVDRYVNWHEGDGECGKPTHDLLLVASVVFLVCIAGLFGLAQIDRRRRREDAGADDPPTADEPHASLSSS